jgi:hypothetical protein
MLNSEANSNFIDHRFTMKYNLPLTLKTKKIPLRVIDGTPIASGGISHHTSLSELAFGKFSETISLNVISIGNYNIVLSIP